MPMVKRVIPGPGQESVWDYPRPPALEPSAARLRVEFDGRTIAESSRGYRVLETSHPPVYYLPFDDIEPAVLVPSERTSFCEFKGLARYYDLVSGQRISREAGWAYPTPSPAFEAIRGYVAFYATRVDACFVDDERVAGQSGDFYGGWITRAIVGPFKGAPGTAGW